MPLTAFAQQRPGPEPRRTAHGLLNLLLIPARSTKAGARTPAKLHHVGTATRDLLRSTKAGGRTLAKLLNLILL